MNDIKVPPFTEAQKMVIEATEKLAEKCDNINANINKWGRKNICDVYGIDEVEMTNEEWLKSANTEQLAEEIYYLTWFHTELDERLDKNVKNGCYNDDENIKIVTEWLKQPHTKN